jgi:ferredoxin
MFVKDYFVISWTSISKRLTVYSDRFSPSTVCLEETKLCGQDFVSNKQTGLSLIFRPFPLSIAGLILDNKWTNAFLCRNRSGKRRCTKYGLCVSVCPSQWLHDDTGPPSPHAGGTCALCLPSVNLCPNNAMQILFFSEYCQLHSPRWPELVVKNKGISLQ